MRLNNNIILPGIYAFFLSFFFISFSFAQSILPQHYFSPPLAGRLLLSGSFGELRPDHFHTGIDFSTQNKENLEVLSVADGYVSRIKISAGGYGKVIYITHPNGFVSVYAHLAAFNVVIDDYVKKKQYEKETFEIELFPNPVLFPLKKGDIIGYSGNSGASGGPHLHFEIRNARTEHPINPLFSGMFTPDTEKPYFESLVLYPAGSNSKVNGQSKPLIIEVKNQKNKSKPNISDTFRIQGNFSFGMEAYDKSGDQGDCGIYSEEIQIDSIPFFKINFDSLSFDEGRFVNALKDYNEYYNNRKNIIQTYNAPGNRLNLYSLLEHKGIYYFNDTNYHTITFSAKNFYGNHAEQNIVIKSQYPQPNAIVADVNHRPLYRYGLKWHFEADKLMVDFPADALYDSIYFDYRLTKGNSHTFSEVHHLHNASVPIHSFVSIKIRPDSLSAKIDRSKLTLARMGKDSYFYVKSDWDQGYLSAKIRNFGNYCIIADTIPPDIKPLGKIKNRKIIPGDIIKFTITDNFSGIDTYELRINGKWVLAEYDAKNDMLLYTAEDNHFKKGNNSLSLTVSDKLKNQKTFITTIQY